MPASAFVLVKHALVLDECFVAVFFFEPVATNKWQKIACRLGPRSPEAATMGAIKEDTNVFIILLVFFLVEITGGDLNWIGNSLSVSGL
jgi:hypothetical protein